MGVISDFGDLSLVAEITRLWEKVTLDSPGASLSGGQITNTDENSDTNTDTINSQSLDDTQVRYISQKYAWNKYTL